jgi:hypothetical protein
VAAIVLTLLIVFYAGAVLATAHAWQQVWRGAVSYSALRDVTGIGDRAALTRLFGASRPDGRYAVGFAQVLKHRRRAGVVLSDLPVHLLFLLALLLATRAHEAPGAEAVIWAAAAHAVVLGFVALSVFARSRQALID